MTLETSNAAASSSDVPVHLTVSSPTPFEVIQRRGVDTAARPRPGDWTGIGVAPLVLNIDTRVAAVTSARLRAIALVDAFGSGTEWTDASLAKTEGGWSVTAEMGAGGWFRVEVELVLDGRVVGEGSVAPVGIGEVFIVAGQSYALGAHETMTTIADPLGRATAASPESPAWRIAHDPQPGIQHGIDEKTARLIASWAGTAMDRFPGGADRPFKGSIWPAMANLLLPVLGVPVGFIHVGVGATCVDQWQKPSPLYRNLRNGALMTRDYRAVLWQLGESDAIDGTSADAYVSGVTRLRGDLVAETGLDRPWLLAKSTIHPAYVSNPAAENEIRDAIERLWAAPGFRRGPDTDLLSQLGVHRADVDHGGHLTALGQQHAALLWFAAAWEFLRQPGVSAG